MNYILFVNIIEEFWWFTLKEENQKFNWKKNLIETKELSFYQKLKLSNPFIFTIWWCKPLIFQTYIIWSNRIHCLKYQRSKTLGSKDIEIRKVEFVTKTQFVLRIVKYLLCFEMHVVKMERKELSLWNKIKYLNLNIFRTRCCIPLIFQTQIIWSNRIHSLKYLRSATFGSKDIGIRKSEFVAKTQFLYCKTHFFISVKIWLLFNISLCFMHVKHVSLF